MKLWGLYVDLEESLGTLESTREVYDRIMELRIATPQIVLNYALYLQVRRRVGPESPGEEEGLPCVSGKCCSLKSISLPAEL